MQATAVVIDAPERLGLRLLPLAPMGEADVLVQTAFSGISTGTERLFWSGRMPPFPGMGYPLVPGYESVGRVVDAGSAARQRIGDWVFVPGAHGFEGVRALFGATASHLVAPAARVVPVDPALGSGGVLLALAATAFHALAGGELPDLIVGHGVLGRLLARLVIARGGAAPTVWETDPLRREAQSYPVLDPAADERRDYRVILDASGDATLLNLLIARLARGGEIVLAGFYEAPLSFDFAPAFQREARIRVAAEFKPADVAQVAALAASGALRLDDLVTHVRPAAAAFQAYPAAFADRTCLKLVLDWETPQ